MSLDFSEATGRGKPRGQRKKEKDDTVKTEEQNPAVSTPVPFKPGVKKAKRETKEKRLQLVMKPSMHTVIKEQADECGLSLNEYCLQIIGNYLETSGLYSED